MPQDDRVEHDPVVALVRCDSYDESLVRAAVQRGLELLGGAGAFVRPGERLLLKPNLLVGKVPERAATTHPAVFRAVAQCLRDAGAILTYGDSPGFGRLENVARKAGIGEVAEEMGIPLADFRTGRTVSFPEGKIIRQFIVAEGVFDADGIVSLPKFKTHALTRVTGAVKNQFGCVPGMLKGEFHARLNNMDHFASMLVDLCRLLRPRLYVMDGIIAMEGNGPGSGTPRAMNALLLSADPVALDATICRMIDLDPLLAPTVYWGEQLGLGSCSRLRVAGDSTADFYCADFEVNRKADWSTHTMNRLLARMLKNRLVPRPVIDPGKCTRCGSCVKMCPTQPKSVDFRNVSPDCPPAYDYRTCIRCYCCQEICPDNAIHAQTPVLGRLLHRS